MLSNFSTSCGALRIHGDIHGVSLGKEHLSGKSVKKTGGIWKVLTIHFLEEIPRGCQNMQPWIAGSFRKYGWKVNLEPETRNPSLLTSDIWYIGNKSTSFGNNPVHLPIFPANLSTSQVAVPKTPGASLPGWDCLNFGYSSIMACPTPKNAFL